MIEQSDQAKPGTLEPLYDASVTWRYMAPSGHTLAMCQRPDYWKSLVKELGQQRRIGLNAWNRVEILAEDGTWEAELRVMSAAEGLVTTRLLREWSAPKKPGRMPTVPDGYQIEHITNNGWRVLGPDGEPIATKLPIEDDAIRAASSHAKQASGKAAA